MKVKLSGRYLRYRYRNGNRFVNDFLDWYRHVIRFLYDYRLRNWHRLFQHHVLRYVHGESFQNSGCQGDATFTISRTCQVQSTIDIKRICICCYSMIFRNYFKHKEKSREKSFVRKRQFFEKYLLTHDIHVISRSLIFYII